LLYESEVNIDNSIIAEMVCIIQKPDDPEIKILNNPITEKDILKTLGARQTLLPGLMASHTHTINFFGEATKPYSYQRGKAS